jgi:hypothetical protein
VGRDYGKAGLTMNLQGFGSVELASLGRTNESAEMGSAPSFKSWGQVGLERAVTGEFRSGGGKGMPGSVIFMRSSPEEKWMETIQNLNTLSWCS